MYDGGVDWPPQETAAQLRERLIRTAADGRSKLNAPDGMVQLTPQAGDFVVASEMTTHCILPWQPTDRPRRALTMRFYSGEAYDNKPVSRSTRFENTAGKMDFDLEEWREHVAPLTRAMLDGVAFASPGVARL